jgi:WhiB family redox-sensing transcriptional regulator
VTIAGELNGFVNREEWVEQAVCSQVDAETFFPEQGGNTTRDAKKICAGCPVQAQCLEYALRRCEPHGIWGGYTDRERRRMRQGLPPKPVRTHCKRGHDLAKVGVTAQNCCKACREKWNADYTVRLEARYVAERARVHKHGAA